MNTPAKLGAFGLGLVAVFGAALGAGHLTGPIGAGAAATDHIQTGTRHDPMAPMGSQPGGLLITDRGYTLTTTPAAAGEFAFRIGGPGGRPVTAFDTEHGKQKHHNNNHQDQTDNQHVHPRMSGDGTWRITTPMSGPGTY